MYFLILFFFFSLFASQDPQTVIVHMPGTLDGGFNFLNPTLFPQDGKFNFKARYNQELNPTKTFYPCSALPNCFIYSNNIPLTDMDLGGPHCVSFYKNMILEAYKDYPNANIILVGGSQGSVGPFGALAELIQKNHPVLSKIKKVLVRAILGSTYETINFHARKIPILNILPYFSDKITPLLAEYLPRFMPGFACYDAFAPQLYHYIQQINTSNAIANINFYMIHDQNDEIIPCSCAQKAAQLLEKNCQYLETKVDAAQYLPRDELKKYKKAFTHLPADAFENHPMIIDFLKSSNIEKVNPNQQNHPIVNDFFISKSPFQRFIIRRIRDVISVASVFIFFKSLTYICKKFIWH
jgi:hypothetical protein